MTAANGFFAELKRRNVLRAAVLYIGAVWALVQGISQLRFPSLDIPGWFTRWFIIAGVIGFPFGVAVVLVLRMDAAGHPARKRRCG